LVVLVVLKNPVTAVAVAKVVAAIGSKARVRRSEANLTADPSETVNLALREESMAERLSALLQRAKSGERLRKE
jgi:hypothetical protein